MRVLVTGANGFIGQKILTHLHLEKDEKFRVAGLVRNFSTNESNQLNDSNLYQADITDYQQLSESLKNEKFDAVVHCAGLAHQFGDTSKQAFEQVNVQGTKNIARIGTQSGSRHFILISSTAVYGTQKDIIDENSVCRPETFYAESKLEAEKACREICEGNGIDLTIFRLAPVLGEKGVGNMPKLIEAIDQGKFFWVGKGDNKKSLIYVDDIADACRNILLHKKNETEIFNLASAPVTMQNLVSIISEELKKSVPRFSFPKFIPQTAFAINSHTLNLGFVNRISKTFEKFLSDDVYSGEKIKDEYGFTPRTSIESAMRKQCRWYIEKKRNKN